MSERCWRINYNDDQDFSIYKFLKDNFQLFVVIGVFGTFLALLPNLLEKIIGEDWKLTFLSNPVGWLYFILFHLTLIAGLMFVLFVSTIIISKLFSHNNFKDNLNSLKNPEKSIFLLTFGTSMFCFLIVISTLFFTQEDPTIMIIYLCIFTIFYFIFITIVYVFLISKSFPQKNAKYIFYLIGIIVLGFVIYFFSIPIPNLYHFQNTDENTLFGYVSINADNEPYCPLNSSQMGIKLGLSGLPENYTSLDILYLKQHWTTNYGYFINGDPDEYLYIKSGPELILNRDSPSMTTYWTYDYSDIGVVKPDVHIFLRLEDIRDKDRILVKDNLTIRWDDIDTANASPIK